MTRSFPLLIFRFTGKDPEPRPGLSSGHMPSSQSLPFSNLLSRQQAASGDYTTLLAPESLLSEVEKVVGERGLEGLKSKEIINSCGSGMTAAVIWLALQELGVNSALYDEVSDYLRTLGILGFEMSNFRFPVVLDWVRDEAGEQDSQG